MNVLRASMLATWLAAWLTASPAPAPAPSTAPAPAAKPAPLESPADNDAATREYREILEKDDAALDEVDRWIQADDDAKAKGGLLSDAALRLRIERRLEPIRQAYEDFLARHPDHINARIAYGSFLNDSGDAPGAIAQWERARTLDPKHPAAWNNAANYYSQHGPVKKAFEYYGRAIELSPDQPVYHQNLAAALLLFRPEAASTLELTEIQVFDRALDHYRRALKLDPTNFLLACEFARAFYAIRPLRTSQAIAAWESAGKLAGDDVQREGVHIHLARVLHMAGRTAEAREHLAKVRDPVLQALKTELAAALDQPAPQPAASEPAPAPAPPPAH